MTAPVVDTRALATRLVCLRVLKDAIAQADAAARAALQAALLVGDRATAAVPGEDGKPVPVGTVTATKGAAGHATAAVTDMDALVAWCSIWRPTEVQTLTIVRPSYQRVLLDMVKRDGGLLNPDSGEVFKIDGITVTPPTPGAPGLMVKPTEGADAEVRAAWADGRLRFADLTEITDGAP